MIKLSINKLLNLFAVLVLGSAVVSCVKVNNEIGNDIIPEKDKLQIVKDEITGFTLYTQSVDSFQVSSLLNTYLGSHISPRLGKVEMVYTTEAITNLTSSTLNLKDEYVVDSCILKLKIASYEGNISYPLVVDMYQLDKNFRKPTNVISQQFAPSDYNDPYYSSFDYKKYIKSEPLTTFTVDVQDAIKNNNGILVAKLPKAFMDSLSMLSYENDYQKDSLFRKKIKGFCFVPRTTYSDGVILKLTPNESHIYCEAYNKKKFEEENKKEDTSFIIEFSHLNGKELYNQAVTTIHNDRSFASESFGADPAVVNDSLSVYNYSYVSSMLGLKTKLKFPVEEINRLKEQLEDSPSAAIIVNSAELEIPVVNSAIGALNNSPVGFGMYYYFDGAHYMPDFNLENNEFDVNVFDGKLNRDKMVYKMNITSYVQKLLNNKTKYSSLDVVVSESDLFKDRLVKIGNTAENKIKLKLTYCVSK